jgi:hypothetical protein
VRGDGAGATHELTQYCRDAGMRFSFGFDLDDRVRTAIAGLPEAAWIKAIRADATERKHSHAPRSPTASTSPHGRKVRG